METMIKPDIFGSGEQNEEAAELSPKQWAALEHLMLGKNLQAVADAVGVDVRTVRRWMQMKSFSDEYHAARRASLDIILFQVEAAAAEAAATIVKLMRTGDANMQLRASRAILQLCQKNKDVADLKQQITDLEKLTRRQAAQIEKLKIGGEDLEIRAKYVELETLKR